MKLLSVNVSQPRVVQMGRQTVMTGIYKEPVQGRVRVYPHQVEGDGQANLEVHGGEFMAVYAYPFEHYAYWKETLNRPDLTPGAFGENLTVSGITEQSVYIGDVFRIGTVLLQVTQPRTPCTKLAHKFGRPSIIKEFLWSGRSGFYLRVVKEGELGAGDEIEWHEREEQKVTVRALLGLAELKEFDPALAARAIQARGLTPGWRDGIAAMLAFGSTST
jgi:MOSC domain-containing protein YiiM